MKIFKRSFVRLVQCIYAGVYQAGVRIVTGKELVSRKLGIHTWLFVSTLAGINHWAICIPRDLHCRRAGTVGLQNVYVHTGVTLECSHTHSPCNVQVFINRLR